MNMQDEIRLYTQGNRISDGTGGSTVTRINERELFAYVKPMSGNFSMNFQQLTGTKGYEVWIRTDFDRQPQTGDVIEYEGIYGQIDFFVHDIEVGRTRTKLLCRSANRI
jgi:SPP1 family predicted phage head-tail adaptor